MYSRFSLVLITILLFLTPLYKLENTDSAGATDIPDHPQPIIDTDHSKPHDEPKDTDDSSKADDAEDSSDHPQPIIDIDHSKPHEEPKDTDDSSKADDAVDSSDHPQPIIDDHTQTSDDSSSMVKPSSSSTPQNESHSEATIVPLSESAPKYGNTVEESKYLIVWEDECLEDVLYDIKVDSDKTDEKVQTENTAENHNDPFAEFERKTIMQMKLFDKIDIIPFLKAIQKNESLSMLDYNFTVFFIYIIAFVSMLLICITTMCIFTFSKNRNTILKKNLCCLRFCHILTFIFICIMSIMLIATFAWVNRVSNLEKDFLCEATRVPHTLFFGNPEIHYNVKQASHFIGFERLRTFLASFLNEFEEFTSGNNKRLIQEMENNQIENSVMKLSTAIFNFKNAFKDRTSTNASGKQGLPHSVTYSLPIYMTFMNALLDRYEMAADRLKAVNIMSPILSNPEQAKEFKLHLRAADSELYHIQIGLSDFWNKIMQTSFQNTTGFKVDMIVLTILVTLTVFSMWAVFCVFRGKLKNGKIKKKMEVRCLMILIIFLVFWTFLALTEVSRTVFTSFYGCSLMHKFQESPEHTRDLIKPFLVNNDNVFKIFDICYFKKSNNPVRDFYELLPNQRSQQAMQQYLAFLDGLKLIHEDFKSINVDTDKFYSNNFIQALESYKNGAAFDFDDVFSQLILLNYNFSCSNIYYTLNSQGCKSMPSDKTICVEVYNNYFKPDDCVKNISENTVIFTKLQNYMQAEVELMDEMISEVAESSPKDSILKIIQTIYDDYSFIDSRVKVLETSLKTHFSTLADGPIETWLDCQVIKQEVTKSYNRLCFHHLYDMTKFLDLTSTIATFASIFVVVLFIMSFCFPGTTKDGYKQNKDIEGTILNETSNYSNVFEEGDTVDADTIQGIEMGQFKTFEQEKNVVLKKKYANAANFQKFNRVDIVDEESGEKEVKSGDEDTFDVFGNQEYKFKK